MAARKAGDSPLPDSPAESAAEEAEVAALPPPMPAPSPKPAAVAAAVAPVARIVETTTSEVKSNMDNAMKTAEELVSFGQGNLEALVKSGQIWAAGVQDLGKQVAASAQAQMDHTMATLKALATAKSLREAMELQTSLARASVEKAVAETGKLTDASLKLAEQTLAPLTARVSLAAERFGRPV